MNRPVGITTIQVRHNIEVAHRLSKLRGKCENIHGHSMWVELEMLAPINENGIMGGMEFGDVKKVFRHHLDTELDHRLLLNKDDPWAKKFVDGRYLASAEHAHSEGQHLPGLQICKDDPTTENLAKWIGEWACLEFGEGFGVQKIHVVVHETSVNLATWTVTL